MPGPRNTHEPHDTLNRWLILLFAVACGATVANLYYVQPLLAKIAEAFHTSDGNAGLLVTVTQVFYAIGLVFVVPLGDLLDRRRLIVRLLVLSTLGLILATAAPELPVLALALAVTAATAVVAQILVPFASTLAPEERRGAVVGQVMSGLLTGILLARTVSGLIAGYTDWRVPFAFAAVIMVLLGLALWRALPEREPPSSLPYAELLRSIGRLIRDEPVLRRRMFYGACGFASFSLVWTTIAFLLSRAPYHYSEQVIGLFGLAGLAGAVAAQGFGRVADRGWGRAGTGGVLALLLLSWGVLLLGAHSAAAVVLGLVLLDFGVQGQQVVSQHVIYGLGREHASRVTAAYITASFIGGAISSAVGSLVWDAGGWTAVCACGIVVAVLALTAWMTEFAPRGAAAARRSRA